MRNPPFAWRVSTATTPILVRSFRSTAASSSCIASTRSAAALAALAARRAARTPATPAAIPTIPRPSADPATKSTRLLLLKLDHLDGARLGRLLDLGVELRVLRLRVGLHVARLAGRHLEHFRAEVLAEVAGDATFFDPDLLDGHVRRPEWRSARRRAVSPCP